MKPFQITLDDYIRAQKLFASKNTILALALLFFIIIVFSVTSGLLIEDGQLDVIGLGLLVFGAAIILALFPYFVKRKYKQAYDSQKSFKEDISIGFDDRSISWESESGTNQTKWVDIFNYKIGASLILIYEAKNSIRIIPFAAFDDEDERNSFLDTLKTRCVTKG